MIKKLGICTKINLITVLMATILLTGAPLNAMSAHRQFQISPPGTLYPLIGTVQSLPSTPGFIGDWKVNGTVVHVTAQTRIDSTFSRVAIGATVGVAGNKQSDGSINALLIGVLPAIGSITSLTFTFFGLVNTLPDTTGQVGDWKVGNEVVHVTASTQIQDPQGALAVGALVTVSGSQLSDGSVNAKSIIVLEGPNPGFGSGLISLTGTINSLPASGLIGDWSIAGRTIHVTAATKITTDSVATVSVGDLAEVDGNKRSDGSVDATRIEVKPPLVQTLPVIEINGMVQALPAGSLIGDWTVNGQTVHVTGTTVIFPTNATFTVGATVDLLATTQTDGSLTALTIILVKAKPVTAPPLVRIVGQIQALPSQGVIGDWKVAGKVIHVSKTTKLQLGRRPLKVGVVVEVVGSSQSDGSVNASAILAAPTPIMTGVTKR